ncbi:DUF5682 family protein [Streptomyces litchfieldiae]|uniref:DUF5682 family protein n=1 Tax=Streptomyces litchfieldiae TaxID=3075543 RepID=A0ABU2MVC9_9ACTN|nr:DUF5682 family protein [Streptomyces sp. DSM 44938]MDT0345605.1 DUF5682 family protein [Streptomyces sp. DSM 44938]
MATEPDPGARQVSDALAELTDPAGPFLIGVRHHAPSLAAAVPRLLDAAGPAVLLVELPAEFQDWLPWLAHEETRAPVALAAVPGAGESTGDPAFYPFADFSPELAALRWAARRGVPAIAADLPLHLRGHRSPGPSGPGRPGLGHALRTRLTGRRGDDLWDRLVEATAPGSPPEAVRRAALLTGWALRRDAAEGPGVDPLDLDRERWMRARLAEAAAGGRRVAAVVGAFHTPALTARAAAGDDAPPAGADLAAAEAWTVSLIPYTYALLDERSGYPAGIRDPEWQHQVLDSAGDPAALDHALTRTAVRICGELRAQDHPAGPADAREITRLAADLARLRGLPAPGRGELIEAVGTTLTQGEPLGRGRAVSHALERVLIGSRTGGPAPGTPRGGLGPAVETEVAELGLPGPADATAPARDLRLDPVRSPLDRRRELLLRRLTVCGIPYAEEQPVTGAGGADAVTTRWSLRWTPATAAMLTAASVRGVTAAQAAEGTLRERHRAERGAGGPTAAQVVAGLDHAAACGLDALTAERLAETRAVLPATGALPELLAALTLLDRLRAAGLPTGDTADLLTAAAVRQVAGLTGSEDPADARALVELGHRADRFGGIRLTAALAALAAEGAPLMRGAAAALRTLLGHQRPEALGRLVASWVDAATGPESRAALTARLTGLLTAAGPLLEASPAALGPLFDRVAELPDRRFLDRLPALRAGFDTLSPAARDRLLDVVEDRVGDRIGALPDAGADADTLALWTRADLTARDVLAGRGLLPAPGPAGRAAPGADAGRPAAARPPEERTLALVDRWRLLLGRRADRLPSAAIPLATALDELYGSGRGEGARGDLATGGRGREAPYPGVREWSGALAACFGPGIREEVLAAAVAAGRGDAVSALDPDSVRPSVELLRTVLSHAGGLPEARLVQLRPLVRRLVDELTRRLATRLRPALTGAALPRPTRRPTGRLDLPRTIRASLHTARPAEDAGVQIIPERPVFRGRATRTADWRLILLTDVSGSMEASTIWSALTAAVLAGVPTLTTHFLAFSTEVVDLTGHVHDPLGLLLEVRIGGGTHIAAALRHARTLVTAPSRTLVVVISDFEEGYPVGGLLAEVRALAGSGAHVLGCASLDDAGRPRYSTAVAGQLVAAGMPVAALSPLELARWAGEKIR